MYECARVPSVVLEQSLYGTSCRPSKVPQFFQGQLWVLCKVFFFQFNSSCLITYELFYELHYFWLVLCTAACKID